MRTIKPEEASVLATVSGGVYTPEEGPIVLSLVARGLLVVDGETIDHVRKLIFTWFRPTPLGRIALDCYAASRVSL